MFLKIIITSIVTATVINIIYTGSFLLTKTVMGFKKKLIKNK